ncbi:MAG: class I SAM-dependent methyltransferase [Devosia sp.]
MDRADFYDAELRRHNEHLRAAAKVAARDHVLDIGCGAGLTTRDAARLAVEGSVLGVDVSAEMLKVARERSLAEGLPNISFELADAQAQAFPPAHFDLCISRFGVMFFADPAIAFANIARTMRPGGRLVWMVWQNRERNEWATAIPHALAPDSVAPISANGAFSLSDPAIATAALTAAGFIAVDFAEVDEPVFYGRDVDAAYEAVMDFGFAQDVLAGLGTADADQARRRLRALLEARLTPDGVHFDSRAWIVTARRA